MNFISAQPAEVRGVSILGWCPKFPGPGPRELLEQYTDRRAVPEVPGAGPPGTSGTPPGRGGGGEGGVFIPEVPGPGPRELDFWNTAGRRGGAGDR